MGRDLRATMISALLAAALAGCGEPAGSVREYVERVEADIASGKLSVRGAGAGVLYYRGEDLVKEESLPKRVPVALPDLSGAGIGAAEHGDDDRLAFRTTDSSEISAIVEALRSGAYTQTPPAVRYFRGGEPIASELGRAADSGGLGSLRLMKEAGGELVCEIRGAPAPNRSFIYAAPGSEIRFSSDRLGGVLAAIEKRARAEGRYGNDLVLSQGGEGAWASERGLTCEVAGAALLALLDAGRNEEFAPAIGKALRFIVRCFHAGGGGGTLPGYIHNDVLAPRDGTPNPMVGHAAALAALARARADARWKQDVPGGLVEQAASFLARAILPSGGVPSRPGGRDADLEATFWSSLALMEAFRSGAKVDARAFEGLRGYFLGQAPGSAPESSAAILGALSALESRYIPREALAAALSPAKGQAHSYLYYYAISLAAARLEEGGEIGKLKETFRRLEARRERLDRYAPFQGLISPDCEKGGAYASALGAMAARRLRPIAARNR